MMNPAAPVAVLWDFDGTLVDTEPLWWAAQYDIMAGLGAPWSDEQALELTGQSLIDSAVMMWRAAGEVREPSWYVEAMVDHVANALWQRDVPWAPGVPELLSELQTSGVPCALVTASYRRVVDAVLARIPADTFAVVVVGDEVEHGKPHPEPYLRAAALLGVDPAATIAVEDSEPGATSANAAGTVVVALQRTIAVPPAARRVRLPDLAGVTLADLRRAWREGSDVA